MVILLSVRYNIVRVEKKFSHSSSAVRTLAFSFLSLSNFPPGYLGIHTTPLCLASHYAPSAPGALSIPSLRTLGPHIPPAPLLPLLDPLPGKCPLASNSQLVPCRDIEFTVTMATNLRQETLSLSWPPPFLRSYPFLLACIRCSLDLSFRKGYSIFSTEKRLRFSSLFCSQ